MLRNDRSVRFLLAVIALLLAGNLLVQLSDVSGARRAMAQGAPAPSGVAGATESLYSGIISQLTELNKKMDRLNGTMESGKLVVKVADAKDPQ